MSQKKMFFSSNKAKKLLRYRPRNVKNAIKDSIKWTEKSKDFKKWKKIKNKSLKIILAQPRGFCAGVERAIEIVERALKIYGPPVYVRHEIVHNKRVVNNLSSKGAAIC